MSKYYDNVSKEIKDYFKILEPDFPEWFKRIHGIQKNYYRNNILVLLVVLYILIYLKVIFSFQV